MSDRTQEQLIEEITQKVRQEYDAIYTKRIAEETVRMNEENRAMFQAAVDEWREEQKPPTREDISLLLSQEYEELTVKLSVTGGVREFMIRELPQSVERKFFRKAKERLIPKINELAEITVKLTEGDTEKKMASVLEMFEPTLDILAEAVAIILNPFDTDKDVTPQWVQDNVSSFRQWNIVLAQEKVNKLRDFFSTASLSTLDGKMKGVGIRK